MRVRERPTVRTARYVMVGAEPAKASRIWFALHGYGMLAARFARTFQGIVPADTCVIAPEALSRFYIEMPRVDGGHLQRIGATWLTRESRDTEIADAHHWLDAVHDEVVAESAAQQGRAPQVAVLGFSQGVATAMRWIANGHVIPSLFVAWAGGFAQDVDRDAFTAKMRSGHMELVFGEHDQFATEAAKQSIGAAMDALNIPYGSTSFDGAHHLDAPVLTSLLNNFAQTRP